MSTAEVIAAAMKLPPKRRAKLAQELLSSLDDVVQPSIDAAWAKEAESRINAFNNGLISSRPAADVFRDAKHRKKL